MPFSNPGRFPATIPAITGAYFFALFAGITASPGDSRAGTMSPAPAGPGTMETPLAYFFGVTLGLPVGTKSTDYLKTMYDISKPYYKPESSSDSSSSSGVTKTEQKNIDFADVLSVIKSLSVTNAINELINGRADYVRVYGTTGYKNLWNTVLADAIRKGQAQSYDDYFSSPEETY